MAAWGLVRAEAATWRQLDDSLPKLLRRHQGRPWTPRENELLRTLPPVEVTRRTGRSLLAPNAFSGLNC
jgi:hypothetical protein